MKDNKKYAVLSLSGGMDSSTLLLRLLNEGYQCTALSFDYGQKHKFELECASALVKYINENPLRVFHHDHVPDGFEESYPLVKHQIIKLDGLSSLLVSGLVDNDSMEMKKGHYAHENALTTVVPNRNAIFAAISYAVALSIVKKTGEPCKIALGTHMGDFDNNKKQGIYPDCSEEFKIALEYAFKIGNWDSDKVDYYAPYNATDKTGVLKDGANICVELGLEFDEIYKRTNTSYEPVRVGDVYYSDFESGSSIERIESFITLGLKDPVQYAKRNGELVSWEFVKEYALNVIKDFKSKKS